MRSICFIVASIAVSLTSAIFTYKKLLYVYPPTIYEYNEHLGGKYAENTIRCKKLDEILAKLKYVR